LGLPGLIYPSVYCRPAEDCLKKENEPGYFMKTSYKGKQNRKKQNISIKPNILQKEEHLQKKCSRRWLQDTCWGKTRASAAKLESKEGY
jgi:hypothetical protein